jgi:pimeloyl-ACP methyl ester carboxylesterase
MGDFRPWTSPTRATREAVAWRSPIRSSARGRPTSSSRLAFLDRLAKEARLIVFNPRGTGLSDRPRNVTLESRMDDFSAVLDDVGSDRVTISGIGQSANACALFAATYPDRCDRLAVANLSPRGLRCESYPYGLTEDEMLENIRITRDRWGERSYAADYARFHEPWQDDTVIDQLVWQSDLQSVPLPLRTSSACGWRRTSPMCSVRFASRHWCSAGRTFQA